MKLLLRAAVVLAGIGMHVPALAQGLICPGVTFSSVVVDGSTPIEPVWTAEMVANGIGQSANAPWGSTINFNNPSPGDWLANAGASNYLQSNSKPLHCTLQPGDQCSVCSPATEGFTLAAKFGNIAGSVTVLPRDVPGSSHVVSAHNGFGGFPVETNTNALGQFSFVSSTDPQRAANHWGLGVTCNGTNEPNQTCDGIGFMQYRVWAQVGRESSATISSSQETFVPLTVVSPSVEDPEIRPSTNGNPPQCDGPQEGHGFPVSVLSGNMFLDQEDVAVPGLPGLLFVRSYNSANKGPGRHGPFGPGWTHTYARRLTQSEPGVLMLRQDDGATIYFQDNDSDSIFLASMPFTSESKVIAQGDGSFVRQFRVGGAERYHSDGRLLEISDPSGNQTQLAYDSSGRLTTVTDGGGRALTLAYAGGLPVTLSGPQGVIASYAHDVSGRLLTVTYPGDSGFAFSYSSTDLLLQVQDREGKVLETHEYDSLGRAVTSELAAGQARHTFVYGAHSTTMTDARGVETVFDFSTFWGRKRITKIDGPCSNCGGGGSGTQVWTYDAKGRITSHTDGAGSVTSYQYDADGHVVQAVDPLGHAITYVRDAEGRIIEQNETVGGLLAKTVSQHGPAGPLTITDPMNQVTRFEYLPNGKLSRHVEPDGSEFQFSYDSFGDLVAITRPGDGFSPPLVTHLAYDSMGRLTEVTDPLSNTARFAYDAHGRVLSSQGPRGGTSLATYDRGDRVETFTDANGKLSEFLYDDFGRLVTVKDSANGETLFGYNILSNKQSITDALARATTFRTDDDGRATKIIYPGGTSDSFTYDSAGRFKSKTDRRGITTTYSYDERGLLVGKSYSDGTPSVAFAYDELRRMTSASNAVDTLTWTYDLGGHVLSEASVTNNSTVSYQYDSGGRRTHVRLNGADFIQYTYDHLGRPKTLTSSGNTFTFGYDAAGRRESLIHPNGLATHYSYNNDSAIQAISLTNSSGPVRDFIYETGPAGHVVSKITPARTEKYGYDALDRLITVRAADDSLLEEYAYDAVGNRVSSNKFPIWSYEPNTKRLLHRGNTTYAYDTAGNQTGRTSNVNTWAYEWNAEGELTRISVGGAELMRFSYDPLGRRVQRIGFEMTNRYTYDGMDVIRYRPGGGRGLKFVHGPGIDELLATVDNGGVMTVQHADALGSIVAHSNSSGVITQTIEYDAFGNILSGNPGTYGFTGREWDPEISLYYYRARYYDPKNGRFISEDPIGFGGGINFYAYVSNQPTNHRDPLGLCNLYQDPLGCIPVNFLTGFGDGLGAGSIRDAMVIGPRPRKGSDGINDDSLEYRIGQTAGTLLLARLTFGLGLIPGKDRAVFWTGPGARQAATTCKGDGRMLNETPYGRFFDKTGAPQWLWRLLSKEYAANAKGDVKVIIRGGAPGGPSIFRDEMKTLKSWGNTNPPTPK